MRDDKPRPIVRLILGEIAELSAGLRRLGLPPDAVERLVDVYVARRLGGHAESQEPDETTTTRPRKAKRIPTH